MADLIDRDKLLFAYCTDCNSGEQKPCPIPMRCHEFNLIKNAPAVNRWIPCSERLPNEAGKYLVCGRWYGEKLRTWICQFIILGDNGGFANPAKNPPISFWMPLPEPPKEVDENG